MDDQLTLAWAWVAAAETSPNKALYNIWFVTHLALARYMLTLKPKSVNFNKEKR
jgi:hypothetical protein